MALLPSKFGYANILIFIHACMRTRTSQALLKRGDDFSESVRLLQGRLEASDAEMKELQVCNDYVCACIHMYVREYGAERKKAADVLWIFRL